MHGIIIENTFVSLESLIPLIMPQIPKFLLPVLLTERWDSHLYLPKIRPEVPMLFLSGRRDSLVPQPQMLSLKKIREQSGGRIRWKELDGEHNDTCLAEGYWDEVKAWLKEIDDAGGAGGQVKMGLVPGAEAVSEEKKL